jgi:hypothetical protein
MGTFRTRSKTPSRAGGLFGDEEIRFQHSDGGHMNDVLFTVYRYLGYELDKDPRKLQEVTEA